MAVPPDTVHTISVLHIDDHEEELRFTKLYLENIEPTIMITSTTSPLKGLELMKSDDYDCILCDYMMDEIDGLSFNEIKSKIKDVPSILYTGMGSEEVAEKAFKMGFSDYLRKEMSISQYHVLVNRIKQCVDKHRAEKEVASHRLYLESVLDAVPAGVIVIDSDTKKVVEVNQRAAALLGQPKEKLMDYVVQSVEPSTSELDGKREIVEIILTGDDLELSVSAEAKRITVNDREYIVESLLEAGRLRGCMPRSGDGE
ncbi:response regulator [Candidatus Bathyarchaeota archaeon]|nr:response regulator [Candidatus Bathyarchaeota archaeon]